MDIAGQFVALLRHVRPFRRQPAIVDANTYVDFLAGRSAFVAQKKLFEYVKQRMGMSYPKHFEDEAFIASLNMAKWHVYAACLSDLSLWMAGHLASAGADAAESREIAVASHGDVIGERFETGEFGGDSAELRREFEARAALADWAKLAQSDFHAFERSSNELVRWAPIAEELKRRDRLIVENSLRYAWLDVREQYRKHLRAQETLVDWRTRLR